MLSQQQREAELQKRAESAAEGGQKRIESAEGGQNSQNALSQQRVL